MEWRMIDMSWYVQQLILHRMEIKSAVSSPYYDNISTETPSMFDIPVENNLESDTYNDVLVVEKAIKNLFTSGKLLENDIVFLERFSWNPYIVSLEKEFDTPRAAISIRFVELCNIISEYLGGVFTDEGYLEYMASKYSLDGTQVEKLRKYMKSNFKNKTMRTTRKNKNNG